MADSPESTILQEEIDEDYEPTEEEIIEFASWLGMELPQEQSLLWIAKQGLKASLPTEWKPCRTEEDEIYYFNFDTGESSWDHPCDEFYRKLYKDEVQKRQQKRPLVLEQKKDTSLYIPNSHSPASAKTDSDGIAQVAGTPRKGQHTQCFAGFREESRPKSCEENTEVQRNMSDRVEGTVSRKSIQVELLEKIKAELEEESGNLMEQKRKEMIEEVERQIEVERRRLQEIQNKTLQTDLDRECEVRLRKEAERRAAWEAKVKQEEEEKRKMNQDLEARRLRKESDLANVMEHQEKSFQAESLQRLAGFRKALQEEEMKLLEDEKSKRLRSVCDKIQVAESIAMGGMQVEIVGRMKEVVYSLEASMYERELELVSDRVKVRVECQRTEQKLRIEREAECEMRRLKEEIVKEAREEMLEQIRKRIFLIEEQGLVDVKKSLRSGRLRRQQPEEQQIDAEGSSGGELVDFLKKAAWDVLLNLVNNESRKKKKPARFKCG